MLFNTILNHETIDQRVLYCTDLIFCLPRKNNKHSLWNMNIYTYITKLQQLKKLIQAICTGCNLGVNAALFQYQQKLNVCWNLSMSVREKFNISYQIIDCGQCIVLCQLPALISFNSCGRAHSHSLKITVKITPTPEVNAHIVECPGGWHAVCTWLISSNSGQAFCGWLTHILDILQVSSAS